MIDKAIFTVLKPLIEQGVLGIILILAIVGIVVLWRKNNALDKDYREVQSLRVSEFKEITDKYEETARATNSVLEKIKYSNGGIDYVRKGKEFN